MPFGKNPKIKILKQTKPGMCGGTDATLDTGAPRTVDSREIVFFEASSMAPLPPDNIRKSRDVLHGFYAFAYPSGLGVFTLLELKAQRFQDTPRVCEFALLEDDFLPELAELITRHKVAENNGFHSRTHGLPENFGGSVTVRYKSGELISISDNQTPILTYSACADFAALFKKALSGSKAACPSPDNISLIKYREERGEDDFRRAALTILADGSGVIKKESRFSGPDIYESEKPVSPETVSAILRNIADTGLLLWNALPESSYPGGSAEKELAFVLRDGSELVIPGDRDPPEPIRQGFFNVELELNVKN